VHTKEPFQKLYNQGMILSFAYEDERGATVPVSEAEEDGEGFKHKKSGGPLKQVVAKMSKTLQNVVNPDEVISDYGADTLRLYEMFMGPLADAKPWNTKDVPGIHRFLNRVWRLVCPEDDERGAIHAYLSEDREADADLERGLHRCIHKVAGDIERLAFNTAIAAMMNFVNEATKAGDKLTRGQALRFVQCLAPFAPHMGEELWSRLSGGEILAYASWPAVDESLLQDDSVEMAVQIMGKLRARIQVAADASEEQILEQARSAVQDQLAGKTIRKEIVVKGRLVNFVAN
jgi:leucyl-tRNA synthetase